MLRKLRGLGLVALALPAWLPEVESLSMLLKITKVLVIRIIVVLVLVGFC